MKRTFLAGLDVFQDRIAISLKQVEQKLLEKFCLKLIMGYTLMAFQQCTLKTYPIASNIIMCALLIYRKRLIVLITCNLLMLFCTPGNHLLLFIVLISCANHTLFTLPLQLIYLPIVAELKLINASWQYYVPRWW